MIIENNIYNTEVSPNLLVKYIDRLKSGCSPGIDGVTAEHPVLANNSKVVKHLAAMFSLCIKFGVVPRSFCKGLMIPLLKKPNADPTCV